MYINSSSYAYQGLFYRTTASTIIQNLILKDVYISNTYNVKTSDIYTAAVTGYNSGKIINCGVEKGTIIGKKTSTNTTSGTWPAPRTGGITGYNSPNAIVAYCYNQANIQSTGSTGGQYNEMYAGGVVGGNYGIVDSCYNGGNITGNAYASYSGGVVGAGQSESNYTTFLRNSYNYGKISVSSSSGTNYVGGVTGRSGWSSSCFQMTMSNNYCLDNTTYSYRYYSGGIRTSTAGKTAAATLKTYASRLGTAFLDDKYNQNSGYPILWYQDITAKLDKKQAYIKVGENFKLNVVETERLSSSVGKQITNADFTWSSTNADVATVDSNGEVTAKSDGYTTIVAHYEKYDIYAMAIVNVASNVANPQVETGNGFTIILKADGTVWGIGNNENGNLGIGNNESPKELVQVRIDEDTYLTNVVKIACRNRPHNCFNKHRTCICLGTKHIWRTSETTQQKPQTMQN